MQQQQQNLHRIQEKSHCDTCPFPEGTRCESAVPCIYNNVDKDIDDYRQKAEFCSQKKLIKWEDAHISSVLIKLKKLVELTQHDISLLNTIYARVK